MTISHHFERRTRIAANNRAAARAAPVSDAERDVMVEAFIAAKGGRAAVRVPPAARREDLSMAPGRYDGAPFHQRLAVPTMARPDQRTRY